MLDKRKQLWFLRFLRCRGAVAIAAVCVRRMHLGKREDDLADQLALRRGQGGEETLSVRLKNYVLLSPEAINLGSIQKTEFKAR